MMERKLSAIAGLLLLCCTLTDQTHQHTVQKPTLTSQGQDCTAIKDSSPNAQSGIYIIQPKGVHKPFKMERKLSAIAGLLLLCCTLTDQTHQHKVQKPTLTSQGQDCTAIKDSSPNAQSGIYIIQPKGVPVPFNVYCEMLADGGWTVFQRRTGGKVSFQRNWAEYKHGFGYLEKDHWLGLAKVWALTRSNDQKSILRVGLWDFEGGSAFAEYRDFRIGDEAAAYKLSVGTYKGTAGDAIRGAYSGIDQNGFGFSTKDRDNDGCSPCIFGDIAERECSSSEGGGGWWFSRCGSANLHGDWHPAGDNIGWASGVHWRTWKGPAPYSLQATRMMVKSV
ncbi:angiopoietin-related protein 5-like isoform X7 [Alosa sapidissima]|uniref:angiopoietin-related protein 5-like isoform X7 n=1 Tax=Alosa sapidissima TaxID=34773 RepID=UPI001C0A4BA1|nr:angiopoietin-related protein 5-like isoform X7 [Alosa sapidissima]